MARDIRTTLAVDGEQAYKRAIQEASKSISQMGTQLSLATAQFKADGDAMKLMETRSKTLRAEIGQQKEIVKSLEGAVKDATAQYGENSREAEKWQAELNRAQTKLINLQHELDNNDKGLDKNGKAFDKDAQRAQAFGSELSALDKIQKSTTFEALNTALGNVENGFKAALSKGKEFAKYIWDEAVAASNEADTLATEADKLGITPQEYRAWQFAAEQVDTSVDAIVKSTDRMLNRSKEVTQAMKDMGVHTKDLIVDENGNETLVQKSRLDLFWETIEALEKMDDAYAQEEAAQAIFGKKYADLIELMHKGRDAWDEAVAKGLETAPAIDNLTTFNDSLQLLDQRFEDFKLTLAEGIAPGLTSLADAGASFLTELTKWAQSEEGQQKLTELSGAITELVSNLGTESNFSKAVEGATGLITDFTGALGWIVTNWQTVAVGVGAIALATGAVKVGSGVLSFLAAIKEIQWLNVASGANALANAAGSGAAGGAAAASAAGGAAASAATGATVTSLISKAFSGAEAFVGALTSKLGLGGLAVLTGVPMIDFFKNPGNYLGKGEEAYESYKSLGIDPLSGLTNGIKNPETVRKGLWSLLGWGGEEQPRQPVGEPKHPKHITGTASPESMQVYAARTVEDIYDELYKAINDYDPATNALDTTQFFDKTLYPLIQEATGAGGVAGDAANEIADLIYDKWIQSLFDEDWEGTTGGLLNILQEAIEEAQAAAKPDAEESGKAVSEGMAAGIDANASAAIEAAGRLAAAVNRKLRSVLGIASPSKVTRGLGQFVGEGFALGIDDAQGMVLAAVNRMASIGTPRRAAAAFAGGTYNGQTYNNSRSIYIDKYNQYSGQDVNDLMERMDAETRYENQGMGA